MESKKINQLATEMSPAASDLTILGDPITGVSKKITLEQIASLFGGSVSFYTNYAAFPLVGSTDTIYCDKATNKLYLWNGAYVQTFPSQTLLDTYQLKSEKGVSNGYASLDSLGKVPISQLPSSIMEYKGTWSATTNTPTLANGTGDTGDVYICNGAGSVNFGAGSITFAVGDYVVYSGSIWQKSGGAVGTLTSVGLSTNGNSITIGNSPITTSGVISANFVGDTTQYINGAGNLITFPTLLSSDNLIKLVRNNSGATMTAGTIVYINGALGNKPTIAKALATGDSTSAQTYGLLQTDISNNADGYVVVIGNVTNLNTSALTEGQQLYLSGTTAGTWTTTKPYAPIHLVYVGIVLRAHPTQGIIGVKIQNGYEMDELHNVDAYLPNNNDILSYNTTTSLWEHKQIATTLGYTPADDSLVVKLSGSQTITGSKTFSGTSTFTSTLITTSNLTFNNSGFILVLQPPTLSVNRTVTLPNGTGTLALLSDIPTSVSSVTATSPLSSSGGTTPNITIAQSSSTISGYLSSTDWNTFNNKMNSQSLTAGKVPFATGTSSIGDTVLNYNGGYFGFNTAANASYRIDVLGSINVSGDYYLNGVSITTGKVTSVTASSPLSSSGGTTPNITIALATTSASGYLSSTDWNTFNNKQAALGYTAANDSLVVHLAGTETITGAKSFSGTATFSSTLTTTTNLTYSNSGFTLVLQPPTLSVNRTLTLPNATGTLALLSDITSAVTSVTATSPLSSSGGYTPNITIAQATTSTSGYLSSTDWNTFNGKMSGASFTSGTVPFATGTNGLGSTNLNYNGGFFGFGTAASTYRVDVSGSVNVTGNYYINGVAISTSGVSGSGTTNYLPKFTGASTIGNSLIYDNGTNVGIGTTTPIGALEVVSSSSYVISSKMNVTIGAFMNRFTNGNTEGVFFGHTGSDNGSITGAVANTVWIGADYISAASYRPLALATSGVSRINIQTNGNILIGTTTDSGYKLDVNGTGRFKASDSQLTLAHSGGTYSTVLVTNSIGNFYIQPNGSFNALTIASTGAATFSSSVTAAYYTTSGTGTVFDAAGAGTSSIRAAFTNTGGTFYIGRDNSTGSSFGATYAAILYESGANPMVFWTNAAERMRITSGGNVLIGTTTDYGYKTNIVHSGDGLYIRGGSTISNNALVIANSSGTTKVSIDATGAATFSSTILGYTNIGVTNSGAQASILASTATYADGYDAILSLNNTHTGGRNWSLRSTNNSRGTFGGGKLVFQDTTAGTDTAIMTLVTGGNVGIGTTSPSALLHLSAVSPYIYIDDTSTSGTKNRFQMVFGDVGTTQTMNFGFNNTSGTALKDVMSLNELGNVLIGTTTDSGYKLDVNGTGRFTSSVTAGGDVTTSLSQATSTNLSVSNTSTSNGAMAQISAINGGASQIDMVAFGSGSTGTLYGITKANLKVIRDNSLTASTNGLAIGTDAAVPLYMFTNSVERMRITSGGLISINNASTSYGQISIKAKDDTYTYSGLNIYNTGGANFLSLTINTTRAVIGADYASGGYVPIAFETNNTERMRIATGGNVLIGTTTNNTGLLQVAGTVNSTNVFRSSNGFMNSYEAYNAWELGVPVSTSGLTLKTTSYITVRINGSVYKLATVN